MKHSRRFLRFNLKSFLIFILFLAPACAWIAYVAQEYRAESKSIAAIQSASQRQNVDFFESGPRKTVSAALIIR
jgi:hypothetical protein